MASKSHVRVVIGDPRGPLESPAGWGATLITLSLTWRQGRWALTLTKLANLFLEIWTTFLWNFLTGAGHGWSPDQTSVRVVCAADGDGEEQRVLWVPEAADRQVRDPAVWIVRRNLCECSCWGTNFRWELKSQTEQIYSSPFFIIILHSVGMEQTQLEKLQSHKSTSHPLPQFTTTTSIGNELFMPKLSSLGFVEGTEIFAVLFVNHDRGMITHSPLFLCLIQSVR